MSVITLSRQYGSGGDEIATRLCEVLGYRYFDKQLLIDAAAQEHLTADQVVDYHEDTYKMRGIMDRLRGYRRPPGAHPGSFAGFKVAAEQVGENMLVWLADAAVRAAYEQGNFVIVGRAGQAILDDKPGVLHVRIEAPMERRIARAAEQAGVSLDAARLIVSERDRAAADYLRRFYGVNWTDPLLYHLSINTGRWDIEGAVELIVKAVNTLPRRAPETHAEPALT
jgi:cytidylate kinase